MQFLLALILHAPGLFISLLIYLFIYLFIYYHLMATTICVKYERKKINKGKVRSL